MFTVKRNINGKIERFKARLCAKVTRKLQKFTTKKRHKFTLTTRFDTIQILLSIATKIDYEIKQFDVKTIFLYGQLEKKLYMQLPEGISTNKNLVCKFQKSIYGLKQSSRCWNRKFNDFLTRFMFIHSEADRCVYIAEIEGANVIIVIYVDDGLIFSRNKQAIDTVLSEMKNSCEIKIYNPEYFVGMEIKRRKEDGSIFISQQSYIKELSKRFNQEDSKEVNVPVDPNVKLTLIREAGSSGSKFPY